MRAKEIPKMLFDELIEVLGLTAHQFKTDPKEVYKAAFFPECWAVLTYEERKQEAGIFSAFRVWPFQFREGFVPEDFIKQRDGFYHYALGVEAGPFSAGVWAAGQGQLLRERVKILAGYDLYSNGYYLEHPIFALLPMVLARAVLLGSENPPTALTYWQKFRNSDGDYTKPT